MRPLAVAAVLVREDGRILMVKRAAGRPAPGHWTPVTGRVEPGESPEACVVREVREEVGLDVRCAGELMRGGTTGADFELVWLRVELVGPAEPLAIEAAELEEARWCAESELESLDPMFETTRNFFAEGKHRP